MKIITFLSDFGEEDHYVGAVKASILSQNPVAQIIDISHRISAFDISHAAYVLSNTFRNFPKGTIHLVAVDPSDKQHQQALLAEIEGHTFVGFDNGIFSLISDLEVSQLRSVPVNGSTFIAKDLLGPICGKLSNGLVIEDLGSPTNEFRKLISKAPKVTKREIVGSVIRIDSYGNLITNIERRQFEKIQELNGQVPFQIRFGRERYRAFHQHYNEAEPGDCYVLFNSEGKLQIGINKGNAAGLLGLRLDAQIFIEFQLSNAD